MPHRKNRDLSDWNGRERPHRKIFEGQYVKLVPLDIEAHGDGLYEAAIAGDAESRFRWLPESVPESREEFQTWLEMAGASKDPMYFTVFEIESGKIAGRQTMMRMTEQHGLAEIGHIHWGPLIQKTPATTEAFYLFAAHLFNELDYRRFEWKCNNRNEASKDSALRYGMTAEGVHRQNMVKKGESRDTAWFSILDYEWAKAGKALEIWLDPANFDAEGRQIQRLEDIRRSL
ncbi:MAG: GNAT family protein [Pseudomonadota bacterium]